MIKLGLSIDEGEPAVDDISAAITKERPSLDGDDDTLPTEVN